MINGGDKGIQEEPKERTEARAIQKNRDVLVSGNFDIGKNYTEDSGKQHPTDAGEQFSTDTGKQNPTDKGKQHTVDTGKKQPKDIVNQHPTDKDKQPPEGMEACLGAMEKLSELRDIMERAGCPHQESEIRIMRILISLIGEASGVQTYSYEDSWTTPLWESDTLWKELPERAFPDEYEQKLGECRMLRWLDFPPVIFGAMFQHVMDQNRRREWGAYYTSEENIMRVISPLFLDELEAGFRKCGTSRQKLLAYLKSLGEIIFMDPACGCGNFLIVAYIRLRELEERIIQEIQKNDGQMVSFDVYRTVSLTQFFGIEYESFQAEMAHLGLWMAEKQLDERQRRADLVTAPFKGGAHIICADALTMDWSDILSSGSRSYVVGNPPFVGARLMNAEQKKDMRLVFSDTRSAGDLDYVAAWYRKTAEYMADRSRNIKAAFVSTNSITQGKQAGILWEQLTIEFNIEIQFAVKTFVWNADSSEDAKVHCVIIGFSAANGRGKVLYDGESKQYASHINGYLVTAPDIYVTSRTNPVTDVAKMSFGSMPNDGGHLILDGEQMRELIMKAPEAEPWVLPFVGSEEYIKGKERYCLWLKGVDEEVWRSVPEVAARVEAVRLYRKLSTRKATNRLADKPELFGEIRQPDKPYIIVPRVSSCQRPYIPAGFAPVTWIAGDSVLIIPGGGLSLFGIIMSSMHMAWVRAIGGRLKSDYRYSASIVYNNFPFPDMEEAKAAGLEELAQEILQVRRCFPATPLGRLYSADGMPDPLRDVHRRLDETVDRLYGGNYRTDDERISFLLSRYGVLRAIAENDTE